MRRSLMGILLVAACGRDVTAPRVLRVVPVPSFGVVAVNSTTTGNLPTPYGVYGTVGQTFPAQAMVVDQDDNRVSGVRVAWTVADGAGSVEVPASTTDSLGIAVVNWTLDTIARTDSIRASISSGASLMLTAAGTHTVAARATKVSGDLQTVSPGTMSEPFVIEVADRYGNPVGGIFVAWTSLGGGALSAATTTTDANGVARVTLTAGGVAATYGVIATLGVLPAEEFTMKVAN